MKVPFEIKVALIKNLFAGKLTQIEVLKKLSVTDRTLRRLKSRYLHKGPQGLIDQRGGNHQKLRPQDRANICQLKREGSWRSARFIKDRLKLSVQPRTVWEVLAKANLTHLNVRRLKPLIRFRAKFPNDLWQTDIMGRMRFPHLDICYLIATLDDHSRFGLSARWFKTQRKMNVFSVWYAALAGWGKPAAMLQDKGSQYHPRTQFGETDYQFYAQSLGIKLKWAKKAQTKGKIERFWDFVQKDFVRENLDVATLSELNQRFDQWMAWYNYQHQPRFLPGKTRAQVYQPSQRRAVKEEIRSLLTIEERRKVTREGTISLYGVTYRVPPGYIGCRIWVKVIGNKVLFESMDRVIFKTRLKLK